MKVSYARMIFCPSCPFLRQVQQLCPRRRRPRRRRGQSLGKRRNFSTCHDGQFFHLHRPRPRRCAVRPFSSLVAFYSKLSHGDCRRRLRRHVKSPFATFTVRKEGSITEQRNSLLSRIRAWESLLPIYIPGLLQYKADHIPSATNTSELPEEAIIWLPSRIPEPYRSKICVHDLSAIEEKLRTAQCTDSLESLRRILRIKSRMVQFKNKNIRGQREGTRSRAVIDRVHERARLAAEKYRAARNAKYCLIGPGDWESRFRTLADGDIRGYQDPNRLRPRAPRRGILEDDLNEPELRGNGKKRWTRSV